MLHVANPVNVLEKTGVTPGGVAQKADLKTIEDRPNGLFAYLAILLISVAFTATETVAAAGVSLTPEDAVGAAGSVYLSYGKHTRANNLSALNLVRFFHQADEAIDPDMLSSYVPVANVATAAGDTEYELIIPYLMAPGITNPKGGEDAVTGLIPLSELKKNGKIQIAPGNSNLTGGATDYWSIKAGTLDISVDMLCVNLQRPVEHVYTYEDFTTTSESRHELPCKGDALVSALLYTDDTTGDIVLPSAFSLHADGADLMTDISGAGQVIRENMFRKDGINDIYPAVFPVVSLASRKSLTNCLPIYDTGYVNNAAGADHSGNYGQLIRYHVRPAKDTQRQIQERHGVDSGILDRYETELASKGTTWARQAVGRAFALPA